MYLVYNSYPPYGSKNSGDDLICFSLKKLLKDNKGKNINITEINAYDYKEDIDNSNVKAVLSGIRPSIKNTVTHLKKSAILNAVYNNIPTYLNAGWKAFPGSFIQSNKLKLDYEEKRNLWVALSDYKQNSVIACRDIYTEHLLVNNGIDCFGTIGDFALFDVDKIEQPLVTPNKIKKIAVSMPHNSRYYNMAIQLANSIKQHLSCEVYITFHGFKGEHYLQEIDNDWYNYGLKFVDLSGGAEKLDFYKQIDAHVGFRLHGNIWFLRNRKPSMLLAEDGRGTGHLATINGLGYPAPPKVAFFASAINPNLKGRSANYFKKCAPPVNKVMNLFIGEIESNYSVTKNALRRIDELYYNKMKKFIDLVP